VYLQTVLAQQIEHLYSLELFDQLGSRVRFTGSGHEFCVRAFVFSVWGVLRSCSVAVLRHRSSPENMLD
jgi:hypothetical protein